MTQEHVWEATRSENRWADWDGGEGQMGESELISSLKLMQICRLHINVWGRISGARRKYSKARSSRLGFYLNASYFCVANYTKIQQITYVFRNTCEIDEFVTTRINWLSNNASRLFEQSRLWNIDIYQTIYARFWSEIIINKLYRVACISSTIKGETLPMLEICPGKYLKFMN